MSNKTFNLVGLYGTHTCEVVQHRENCYSVREVSYEPSVPYTPEELAAQAASEAEFEAYAANFPGYEPEPECYTTAEAAQRAAELCHRMSAADDDLRAFGAPSECWPLALCPIERELDELEKEFGTRLNPPTLGEQYAERGLEDRTRPIRESLPAGMHDDTDVIAALGERSAIDPDDCYVGVHPSNY